MKTPFKTFLVRADKILAKDLTPEEKLSQIMKIAKHFSESIEEKIEESESIRESIMKTAERYTQLAEENKTNGTVAIQEMNYRIAEVVSSILINK